jgi:hypothetical protein
MIENPETPETEQVTEQVEGSADTADADAQAKKDAAGILAVLKVAKNLSGLIGTVDPNNCPKGAEFALMALYPVACEIVFKLAVVQGNASAEAGIAVTALLNPLRAFIEAGRSAEHPLSEELYQLGRQMIETANGYAMSGEPVV